MSILEVILQQMRFVRDGVPVVSWREKLAAGPFVGFHRKPSQPHVAVTGDELDRQMSGQRLTAAHQQASEPCPSDQPA